MNSILLRTVALSACLSSMTLNAHTTNGTNFVFIVEEEQEIASIENAQASRAERLKKAAVILGITVAAATTLYLLDKYAVKAVFGKPTFSQYIDGAAQTTKDQLTTWARCFATKYGKYFVLPAFFGGKKATPSTPAQNTDTQPEVNKEPAKEPTQAEDPTPLAPAPAVEQPAQTPEETPENLETILAQQ